MPEHKSGSCSPGVGVSRDAQVLTAGRESTLVKRDPRDLEEQGRYPLHVLIVKKIKHVLSLLVCLCSCHFPPTGSVLPPPAGAGLGQPPFPPRALLVGRAPPSTEHLATHSAGSLLPTGMLLEGRGLSKHRFAFLSQDRKSRSLSLTLWGFPVP